VGGEFSGGARPPEEDHGRLRVRPLLIVLGIQFIFIGGLLWAASRSFDFLGFLTPSPNREQRHVPRSTAHRFDAPGAMALVRRQLAFGPRPAGSPQLRRLADELRPMLPNGHFEPVWGHPGLRNIVGDIPGRSPALLLGAHYDTDVTIPHFVGANDSAAGTAALIELSRYLRRAPLPANHRAIRFVLFDGEEEPQRTADFFGNGLRGSKSYVAGHPGQIGEMVLLDYIANKGLRLPREASSNKALWGRVRTAGHDVGVGEVFPDETETTITDDQTPFLRAGIPAVDVIDWDYPYANTVQDTYDKLSTRAMDATGETLALLAERESAR
jgi:hypothetical protein